MHASTEPNSQSVCETRIRRRFHLCLGCIGVIIFQLLPACILFHRNQHVWNLAQVWAALIITTRQNLLRQTSIFATGPFKRNIVLLYTVPSVIYIIFGTCTYFQRNLYCPTPLEPVRNTRELNIGLIHPSVHQCTAPEDQLLIQPRVRLRCLTFDTVSNYHSLLRYSAWFVIIRPPT